jgi:hypothetical protein
MVQNTGDLAEQGTDPLRTLRHLNIEKLLHGERETLLVRHHTDIVQAVEVWESLQVGLVLDQLLRASVQQSDVRICAHNFLSVELQNQP